MKRAKQWFWKLLQFRGGADVLECALLAALILLGTVAAESSMVTHITHEFTVIGNSL